MKLKRLPTLAIGLLTVIALPAAVAYTLDGKRWVEGTTTFYTGIPGFTSTGQRWAVVFEDAMRQWTDQTDFDYVVNRAQLDPCTGYTRNSIGRGFPTGSGDRKNGAGFNDSVCGNDFGSGVLAITLTLSERGNLGFSHIVETDIVFNDDQLWDIYSGPRRVAHDFGRVALHELGHALGLNHEQSSVAIMAPNISDIDTLQSDDIAGVDMIYGTPGTCPITELPMNGLIRENLSAVDCHIMDLYGGGDDKSYVDVYRLKLDKPRHMRIDMRSTQVDTVMVLADKNLKSLEIADTLPGTCDSRFDLTLEPGEYFVLANTYTKAERCGISGAYTLSVTDSALPQLGDVRNLSGGAVVFALINGGATSDGGASYRTEFSALENIDVVAQIAVDSRHVGQAGKVLVYVVMSDGKRYSVNSSGVFVPFSGDISQLSEYKKGNLAALEPLRIASGLQGRNSGLAGQTFTMFVGYALNNKPQEIHYSGSPIRFSIAP